MPGPTHFESRVDLPNLRASREKVIRSLDKLRVDEELRRKFDLPHATDANRKLLEEKLDDMKLCRETLMARLREMRPILTIVYQQLAADMPLFCDLCSGLLGIDLASLVNPRDVDLRATVNLDSRSAPMLRLEVVSLDAIGEQDERTSGKTDVLIFVAVPNIDLIQLRECKQRIQTMLTRTHPAARFVILADQEPEKVRKFVDQERLSESISVGCSGEALKGPGHPGQIQLRNWVDLQMARIVSTLEKPQDEIWAYRTDLYVNQQRDFSMPGVPEPAARTSAQYPTLPRPLRRPFTDTQEKLDAVLSRFGEEWPADAELIGEGKLGEQLRQSYPADLGARIEAGIDRFLSSTQSRSANILKPSDSESKAVAFAGHSLKELWNEIKEELINAADRVPLDETIKQAITCNMSWFDTQLRTIPDLAEANLSFSIDRGYPIAPLAEAVRSALNTCDEDILGELSMECADAGKSFLATLGRKPEDKVVVGEFQKWSWQWILEKLDVPWGRKPKPIYWVPTLADPDKQRSEGEAKLRTELVGHLRAMLEKDGTIGCGPPLRRRLNEAFQRAAAANLLPLRLAAAAYVAFDTQSVGDASRSLERLVSNFAVREALRKRLRELKSEEAANLAAHAGIDVSELSNIRQSMVGLIQTARKAFK